MPPRTRLRPPTIPGLVPRSGTYRVATLAEIDANLRGLKTWLIASIDERPASALEHIYRYNADVDALLDARTELMRPEGPCRSVQRGSNEGM